MRSREAVISAQATAPASAPRISRIVLAYAVTSVIWIATSDQLVEFLFSDRAAATEISIGKGVLFVVLTSWLLYALLRRYQYQMERAYEERFGTLMLLEAISESCTDAIYAKTLDGRYTFANQAVASILGVPLSEIVGKMDADLFPSAEAARIARSDQAIIGQGTPITVTEVLPTPTGPRIFDTTKGRLMKKEGALAGIFGISRDATARMAAAEGMQNAAVELAATLRAIPDVLFAFDEKCVYREVWTRDPGLLFDERERLLGKNAHDVLPGRAAQTVAAAIAEAKDTGTSSGQVIEVPLGSGRRWFELSTAKKGVDGEGVAHFLMLSRDITKRKLAEEALSQHQEYLRLTLAFAPAALAMFDRAMRYLTVSERWLTDYKLNRDAIIGRFHHEIFPQSPDAWNEARLRALEGEVVRAEEDRIMLPDGSERWLRWEFHPWRTVDGAVGGVVIFSEDITERKVSDAKIAEYVSQIERTARAGLQLVANAAGKRDPYTSGHQQRVGLIAADIALKMGWSSKKCRELEMIGLVHDVGKIGIPSEILTKPSRLTPTEFQLIKAHPQMGYEILAGVEFPTPVAEIILQHHEHLDGTGYPRGLKGAEIHPETRIITVADVLESMASHRPYRPAKGVAAALEELEAHSGTWYDPEVVRTVVRMVKDEGYELPPA